MGRNAICYFSATGNGYYIAKELKKHLQGDLWYIPNVIGKKIFKYEKVIIVSPIYMFAIPNIVNDFIASIGGQVGPDYYVVLNYGGFSSNAPYYTKNVFEKNGLELKNVFKIVMPVTYTLFMREPSFIINKLVKEAGKKVEKVARKIDEEESRNINKNIFSFMDKLHDNVADQWGEFGKSYTVNSDCDRCGYCVKICSAKNIRMTDEGIVFDDKCISCLACYHRCPQKAINVGKGTEGKARYTNPLIDLDEMLDECTMV